MGLDAGSGQLIGAGISAAVGIGQSIAGIVKNKKANNITIDETDSQQTSLANEILARSRAAETGAAYTSGKDKIGRNTSSIVQGILGVSGGAGGSSAATLARLGETVGQGFNEVMTQQNQQQMQYTGLASQLINDIAQRRLEVRYAEKMQQKAEATQLIQDGMGNIMGSAAMLAGQDPTGAGDKDWVTNVFNKKK